jgi:hypothetical protein
MSDLLVFGDSFPAGAELNDLNQRFPVLVAQALDKNLIDFSKGSTSIDHMVLALMTYLESSQPAEDCVALFCVTDASRTLYFNQGRAYEITPHSHNEISNTYFRYFYNTDMEEFNWKRNIGYLEYACYKHRIKSFFISNWKQPYDLAQTVKRSYFTSICELLGSQTREYDSKSGVNSFKEELKNQTYFDPGSYHPNANGHALIAQHLSKWIKLYE